MRAEVHAFARGYKFKAAGFHPINQFAHRSGLIAVGHRINDTLFPRTFRQYRAAEHVSFNVDHDHMFARINRANRVANTRERVARGFDDAFDAAKLEQIGRVVGEVSGSVLIGLVQRRCRISLFVPVNAVERSFGFVWIKVGNPDDVIAGDVLGLR